MVGLLLALIISANVETAKGKAVKIVEEPAVYRGVSAYYQQSHPSSLEKKIVARVKEKLFTGPSYFKPLDGKCFLLQQNGYNYKLCPFHNVTQKEESSRWNAFSGVLGVWKEWVIINNTFQAMLMNEGDLCQGNTPRETKVFLKCGEDNTLKSVKEPNMCKYEIVFHTPLACPVDSLLVFPALSPDAQKEWLDIEKRMYYEELTVQGYNKYRRKLFLKAGFLPKVGTEEQKEPVQKPKGEVEDRKGLTKGRLSTESVGFHSLEHCSEAYKKLEDEVKKLQKLLNISKSAALESESLEAVQMPTYKNESLKTTQEESSTHKKESLKTAKKELHKNESPRNVQKESYKNSYKNESLKTTQEESSTHKKESLKTAKKELHKNESPRNVQKESYKNSYKNESLKTVRDESTYENKSPKPAKKELYKNESPQNVQKESYKNESPRNVQKESYKNKSLKPAKKEWHKHESPRNVQ